MKAKISIYVVLFLLAIASTTWAKIIGPARIEPVACEGMRFTSPNKDGIREYVEVWDAKSEKKISEVTVFTNSLNPELEADAQWVFIRMLLCSKGNLLITDEHSRHFQLDLKTMQVTQMK